MTRIKCINKHHAYIYSTTVCSVTRIFTVYIFQADFICKCSKCFCAGVYAWGSGVTIVASFPRFTPPSHSNYPQALPLVFHLMTIKSLLSLCLVFYVLYFCTLQMFLHVSTYPSTARNANIYRSSAQCNQLNQLVQ